jgi:YVTN family beta-propeller protein
MKINKYLVLTIMVILSLSFSGCFFSVPKEFELGSIGGMVQDQNLSGLSDVEVTIVGTGSKCFTDDTGAFYFPDLEPGAYTLNIFKQGYQTQQKNLSVMKGQSKVIVVQFVAGGGTQNNSIDGGINTTNINDLQNQNYTNNQNGTSSSLLHMLYVSNAGNAPLSPDQQYNSQNPGNGMYTTPGESPDTSQYGINEQMALLYGHRPDEEAYRNTSMPEFTPESIRDFQQTSIMYRDKKKNNLLVINSITRGAVSIIEWTPSVMPMYLDMTDNGILCLADSSNNITLMNTNSNNAVTSTVPMGNNIVCDIAIGNSNTRLFCALMGAEPSVGVIDIVANSYIKTINLPRLKDGTIGQPWGIGTYRSGQKAYVTLGTATGGELVFINTNTNSVEGTVTVGQNPFGVAVTPDGTKIYVANQNSGNVSVVDANTRKVITTITVGMSPLRVAVSPDGSKAIVTNQMSNNVSVIDVRTNSVITTLPVGKEPMGVSISRDGKRAYVANHSSDSISMIDLSNNSWVGNTIPVPGGKPYDVVAK